MVYDVTISQRNYDGEIKMVLRAYQISEMLLGVLIKELNLNSGMTIEIWPNKEGG